MTDFNRQDPLALGIESIEVIPHRLPDENPEGHLPDYEAFEKAECGNRKAEVGIEALPNHPPQPLDPQPATCGAPPHKHQSSIPNPPFNILYAGHLYDLKGTPQLVEAFAEIAPKHPQTKLVLMGEFLPPYTQDICRARCRDLGIEDRVEITGVLRGENKAAQFRAAHLFVFPSVAPYESFGLVLAEAMMWGLPIVATDWRGNRNVAGSEAVYCQTHDSQTLSRLGGCLLTMLSDLQKIPLIAKASRGRYESHYRLGDRDCDYCDVVDRSR
ncbi:MAG: glycosyltransferase family 4 protein [Terrimicrobiaceae bacterium]